MDGRVDGKLYVGEEVFPGVVVGHDFLWVYLFQATELVEDDLVYALADSIGLGIFDGSRFFLNIQGRKKLGEFLSQKFLSVVVDAFLWTRVTVEPLGVCFTAGAVGGLCIQTVNFCPSSGWVNEGEGD